MDRHVRKIVSHRLPTLEELNAGADDWLDCCDAYTHKPTCRMAIANKGTSAKARFDAERTAAGYKYLDSLRELMGVGQPVEGQADALYPMWRYHLWHIGFGSYNDIEAAIGAGRLRPFTCTKADCDCRWPKVQVAAQPAGEGEAPELLPCPFCGSDPRIGLTTWGFSVVRCVNPECRASSYHRKDRDTAITAWNMRHPYNDADDTEVERAVSLAIIQTQRDWRIWLWNEFQIDVRVSNDEARQRIASRFNNTRVTQPATAPSELPVFKTTKEAMEYAAQHQIPTVIPATTPADIAERARRAFRALDDAGYIDKDMVQTRGSSDVGAVVADIIAAEFGGGSSRST